MVSPQCLANQESPAFRHGECQGEAKCSPDDVFDEEIGKHIARTRLINKYNRVVAGINRILLKLVESDMRFLRTRQRKS